MPITLHILSQSIITSQVPLLFPLYRWVNWSAVFNLFEVAELDNSRGQAQTLTTLYTTSPHSKNCSESGHAWGRLTKACYVPKPLYDLGIQTQLRSCLPLRISPSSTHTHPGLDWFTVEVYQSFYEEWIAIPLKFFQKNRIGENTSKLILTDTKTRWKQHKKKYITTDQCPLWIQRQKSSNQSSNI